MSGRLDVPKREPVTKEAIGRVGMRGTWRGRVYRRNGELVELRGDNLFLNSGLDLIGSRFDTLGMAAETDPAYRFENWLPHLALGSNDKLPEPTDQASVLNYVAHVPIQGSPTVTESLDPGRAERVVEITLPFEYTAVGGETLAEMGLCHWPDGRHLTRSLIYDLAGNPVTVALGAGDTMLITYFLTLRTPAVTKFTSVPMPEGDLHTWQVCVGVFFLRRLLRYGYDSNNSPSQRPITLSYPWVSAWRDPLYTESASSDYRPLKVAQIDWSGTWQWIDPLGNVHRVKPTDAWGTRLETQRAWERLPYEPGSHRLSFAVSALRSIEPRSGDNLGMAAYSVNERSVYDLLAVGHGVFPKTDTYLRLLFTISWGNA